jgi:hypothetical protein
MAGDTLSGTMFTELASAAGLSAANGYAFSTSWVDYNNDGLVDLWVGPHIDDVPSAHGAPRPDPLLFKNLGNGKFTNVYAQLFPDNMPRYDLHGALWFDYDNDGDQDLLQTVGGNRGVVHDTDRHINRVYVQDQGQFRLVSYPSGLANPLARGREAEMLDVNLDGLPDVFLSDFVRADGATAARLYSQTSRGYEPLNIDAPFKFDGVDLVTSQYNDVTGDGKSDLVVLDSEGKLNAYSRLAGTPIRFQKFESLLPDVDANASLRDFVIGDFNNDSKNDILQVRRESSLARVDLLVFNATTKQYAVRNILDAQGKQLVGGSVTIGDYNNDQFLDAYISAEYGTTDAPDYLLMNNKSGGFTVTRVTAANTSVSLDHGLGRKAITADYDRDGDLDIFLNSTGDANNLPRLLNNPGNANRWVNVELEGVQSTRDGVGARVTLKAGGVTQTRYQTTGKHHFTQDDPQLHFGLGSNTKIESIKVVWPSGRVTELLNLNTNRTIKIQENLATSKVNARTIPVVLNAGNYSDTIFSPGTSRFFRFAVAEAGSVQLNYVGGNANLKLETAAGSVLAEGSTLTNPITLAPGIHFLSVKNASTGAINFSVRPIWTPAADKLGPRVEELVLDNAQYNSGRGIMALVNDGLFGQSKISAAKMWINSLGTLANGINLRAVDGAFDHVAEMVAGEIPAATYNALAEGTHTLFVRGGDDLNNWGVARTITFTKSTAGTPQLLLGQTVVTSNGVAKVLAPNATVTNLDSTNLAGAMLVVSLSNARLGDRLDFAFDTTVSKSPITYSEDRMYYQGKLVARAWGGWAEDTITTYNLEPLVIKFTAQATLDAMNAVISRIRFQNDGSSTTAINDRTITFLLTGGNEGRVSATQTLRFM